VFSEGGPYKLDLFEQHIYVTMRTSHSIYRLHKFGFNNATELVVKGSVRIGDLFVVQQFRESSSFLNTLPPCHDDACHETQLCLNGDSRAKCVCPNFDVPPSSGPCQETLTDSCKDFCQHGQDCIMTEEGKPKCK
jgi:hypothetical protein